MTKSLDIAIMGRHGEVAMRLARLLTSRPDTQVVSIFRNPDQTKDVTETGASPLLLSLEDDPVEKFVEAFQNKNVVYFYAGATASPERTRKVDFFGALKVFDAIERVDGAKPRLIMVSAIDVRDRNVVPAHYNAEDKEISDKIWGYFGPYMQAKYDADKDLVQRTAFKWTILRPGGLSNNPGTGKATIGRTHLKNTISRDDVAYILGLLVDLPDAAGLAIDMIGGSQDVGVALEAFIKKGETDFPG